MYNLIIKNGLVWDSDAGSAKENDIAVENGKIAFIGKVDDSSDQIGRMTNVIDAAGCTVFPGLIDMHAHVYPLAAFGTSAETSCFSAGVTTVLDCGSAGTDNYEQRRGIIDCTRLQIKTLINVSPSGVLSGRINENLDPSRFDRAALKELAEKYKGEILGLKVRQGQEIVGDLGLKPLEAAIEIGEELGLPVMVHCTNPPGELDDLVNLLRKGDVLTHTYMGKASTIINEKGEVSKAVRAARERGVIMDVANANAHFAFSVAEAALKDNFKPDIISTDQTFNSLYRRPNAYNLLHIMAKYLCLGMTLDEVIRCTTTAPAAWMGLSDSAGAIRVNAPADLAVIQIKKEPVYFGDYTGVFKTGDTLLKNRMTVKNGIIVYRDQEF